MVHYLRFLTLLFTLLVLGLVPSKAQQQRASFTQPSSRLWLNTYGNVRLKGNYFLDFQTHIRFSETAEIPMAGQLAQIYNRQGLGYIFSKRFNATLGFVYRLNRNLNGVELNETSFANEWRIWHQYQFAMPFSGYYVYHRLRIEHRWSKNFEEQSPYIFRNRFRYMFNIKIPLNKSSLEEKTWYVAPEAELIMQSGQPVNGSPMEDLRLHTSVGYILNKNLILASGAMYSFGQDLSNPYLYQPRFTLRLHVYYLFNLKGWNKNKTPFSILR